MEVCFVALSCLSFCCFSLAFRLFQELGEERLPEKRDVKSDFRLKRKETVEREQRRYHTPELTHGCVVALATHSKIPHN